MKLILLNFLLPTGLPVSPLGYHGISCVIKKGFLCSIDFAVEKDNCQPWISREISNYIFLAASQRDSR